MMTSKERMMAAVNREKPDRLPVTIHQWQQYHLDTYMHGMTDIEANRWAGFDAAITVFEATEPDTPDWRVTATKGRKDGYDTVHYHIETPEGPLSYTVAGNAMTTWVTEHMIKEEEDIQLLRKYRPVPKLNKQKVYEVYDALGDDGIVRSFVCGNQGGCWQDACELFGVTDMIMATFENPEWVHEFMQILLEKKLAFIEESMAGMPFDLVETGGGAASNTVISPTIHREFCLPYDRQMHDALKREGFKTVYHTCGGMTKILDLILQNGCDCSETLSPAAMGGDITDTETGRMVFETMHPHVGLIGGMDQFHMLEEATPEEIRKETARLFDVFGRDGGYILSACDHFFKAPPENLRAFAEAAKEFRY